MNPSSQALVFAHTRTGRPQTEWEALDVHLNAVADGDGSFPGASGFAAAFDAADIARLAGLWHDIGKYAPQFQQYLLDAAAGRQTNRVDHSTAGALLASRSAGRDAAGALAFVIAGHHAGLPDLGTPQSPDRSCLMRRLKEPRAEATDAVRFSPPDRARLLVPPMPQWLSGEATPPPLRLSLFIRMLFSCLIDADRIATERFCSQAKAAVRSPDAPSVPALRGALDEHLARFVTQRAPDPSPVDGVRAELLRACRAAADWPPGLFSLTAPTGSGKTLSSMAFALRHAELHGLRRVIYALPFTSVTEQNADVFRSAFRGLGPHAVLEHHSAYRPREQDESHPTEVWRRLAAENWDAPIVVTTNVQLLESLFASNPSECRKLHRIARSVIILDEAQSLPVDLLKPTLAALQELASSYSVSVVLASATMPAVGHRADFPIGLKNVHEIVPEPQAMSRSMRRARVTPIGPLDDESLADRIAAERQILAIVNTRKHAARLFGLVRGRSPDVLHLSAIMCPEHRSRQVAEIRQRLAENAPCRVVSTQVVEAGVDIDFPTVFRAFAGLDSIIQAAGRCNREGRLSEGHVVVFDTDEPPPRGILGAIDATRQVLGGGVDTLDLNTIESFFRLHYWQRGDPAPKWDGPVGSDGRRKDGGITDMLSPRRLMFRTAEEHYKLIDERSVPIIVPYCQGGRDLCGRLHAAGKPDATLLRNAQRYTVNIPPADLDRLVASGYATVPFLGPAILVHHSLYDDRLGLRLDGTPNPPAPARRLNWSRCLAAACLSSSGRPSESRGSITSKWASMTYSTSRRSVAARC